MMRNGDLERGKSRSQKQYSQAPPPQQYHAATTGYGMEYSDRNHYWTSWLVPSIIVANIAMFIVIMYVNNCPQNPLDRNGGACIGTFLKRFSFQPFRQNPLLGPSARTLEKLGGLEWNKVVHQNQGWRLISCIWLHAGLFHLAANMISLVIVGIRLEQQFGFIRIGVIYLLSGIGGSILSALFIQQSISVGASGALFGLLGAMLSELLTNWTIYSNKAAALFSLIVIIVINLAVGILPMVDNFAHIGGFVSGVLLGFVLLVRPQYGWLENKHLAVDTRPKSKYTACQYILWIVGIVLFILGFAVALGMLFRGENANDRCSWCHYLSCVPTSRWSCNNH